MIDAKNHTRVRLIILFHLCFKFLCKSFGSNYHFVQARINYNGASYMYVSIY